MAAPNVAEYLARVARALDGAGIPWFVFGAQAVIAAGAVRVTADVDVTTADVPSERILKALRREGFVPRRDIAGLEELVEAHRILPLEHKTTGYRLDVVRGGPGLDEQILSRVIFRSVGRRKIPFIETNDLVAMKILAGREQDLADVRALLQAAAPEISHQTIRERLGEFSAVVDDSTLVPLFEQVLGSAGSRPPRAPAGNRVRRRKPR